MSPGRLALLVLLAASAGVTPTHAEQASVVLLPTTARTSPLPAARPRRDLEEQNARVEDAAREIDLVLSEAVQDLGLTLDLTAPADLTVAPTEEELVARAATAWVIAPEVAADRGELVVRIVAVAAGSRVVLSRRERVHPTSLEVDAMRLLRDVVDAGRAAAPPGAEAPAGPAPTTPAVRARSPGRPVLALNMTVLGGYAGLSVQQASGSDDARLVYPLTALGAGLGLGASMIVADEWNVTVGDAWFVASGMHWPGAAGLLLAHGYAVEPTEERYLYGLVGAAGGTALATAATGFGHVDGGGAALAHSGGLFGTFFGGLLQAAIAGTTTEPLHLGLGYGAIGGVIVAGAAGTRCEGSASRVLFVDLLGGLGALGGAALGSPLMVGDYQSPSETRGWLACIGAGTLTGIALGAFATRPEGTHGSLPDAPTARVLPYGGVISAGTLPGAPPFVGAGLVGTF